MKEVFIDVETTGTDPKVNGIIQLSGIIEIDSIERDRFDFKVKPFDGDVISDEALKVSGVTREMLSGFEAPNIVKAKLTSILSRYVDKYNPKDKYNFIAYNSSFDDAFVRSFFLKNRDKYYGSFFRWPSIDVAVLASCCLNGKRSTMPDFKLKTVARSFGITVDETRLHDSMYDIDITRQIYRKIKVEMV